MKTANKSSIHMIGKYVRKHWIIYSLLSILVILGVVNGILSAWFLQHITDAAISGNKPLVVQYFIVGVFVIVLMMVLHFSNTYLTALATNKVKYSIKTDLYNHILQLPTQYMHAQHSGDLNARINQDVEQIDGAIGNNLIQLIRLPLWAIASFIYLLTVKWQLACLTLLLGPLALFISKIMGQRIRENSMALQQHVAKSVEHISDTLTGHTTIRIFGLEKLFSKAYKHRYNDVLKLQMKDGKLQGLLQAVAVGISFSAQILVLGIGAFFVVDGRLTMGALMAFITLSQGLISPFSELGYLWGGFQRSLAATDRVAGLLSEPIVHVHTVTNRIDISKGLKKGIAFSQVSFGYEREKLVLHNINVHIAPGKKVAIVGPSGAGKSTLFQLLLGLYTPHKGKILIDSLEVNESSAYELRKYISLVPQDTYLFHGTIGQNIIAGSDATEAEMIEAAKLANADQFIRQLSDGYNTEVGENGVRLSGGQKQKIAIARALLRNTPILLLDEATSSLDSQSEADIQNALQQLTDNRTTLIIAHRLSTVMDVDYIIVLDEGEIKEVGTHEQLLAQNGLYTKLCQLQFNIQNEENKQATRY